MSFILDFFGTCIKVNSDNERLTDNLSFIFRSFQSDKNFFDYEFKIVDQNPLNTYTEDGILSSLSPQNIFFKKRGDTKYKKWESEGAFLPPIELAPLHNKFLVMHGCAVKKNGKTFVFLAPSMSGKTSLVLYLLQNGYKCISDDLLFIDRGTLKLYTYKKPIGVRETSLVDLVEIKSNVEKAINETNLEFTNYKGKKTWLVHLEDLIENSYSDETEHRIDYLITIDKDLDSKIEKLGAFECFNIISSSIFFHSIGADIQKEITSLVKESKTFLLSTKSLPIAYAELELLANE